MESTEVEGWYGVGDKKCTLEPVSLPQERMRRPEIVQGFRKGKCDCEWKTHLPSLWINLWQIWASIGDGPMEAWVCSVVKQKEGWKALGASLWTIHDHESEHHCKRCFMSFICSLPRHTAAFEHLASSCPPGPRSSVCGCLSLSSSSHFFFPPPFPPLLYPYVSGNVTEIKTPANKVLDALFAVREEQLCDLIPTYAFISGEIFNSWEYCK